MKPNTAKRLGGSRLFYIALLGLCSLLLFVALARSYPQWADWDQAFIYYLRGFTCFNLVIPMKVISFLGSAGMLIAIAFVALVYTHRRRNRYRLESLFLAFALTGIWIFNEVLKVCFQRPRPQILSWASATGYSFPSGHAMVAFTFYGLLGYFSWYFGGHKGRWYAFLNLMLAMAIGLSRIYLGVHFPTDVLAGFAAGGVCLAGIIIAWGMGTESGPNNRGE